MPKSMVILTGAGISAESGIKTFRATDGLWEEHRIEDVATPEGFQRNPALVQRFYNERRRQLLSGAVAPNAAHEALARLESEWPGQLLLITQNVDDLHERAGSSQLVHMHGQLLSMLCTGCQECFPHCEDIETSSPCPGCHQTGTLRPDIVWFNEMPYDLDRIVTTLSQCDYFVSIGTSGNVYPAAGFVDLARQAGAHTVELNLEPSIGESLFAEKHYGPASRVVSDWVDRFLEAD